MKTHRQSLITARILMVHWAVRGINSDNALIQEKFKLVPIRTP